MLQFEKKIIEWINHYIVHIAIFFVLFAAAWMRLAGRNYVGIDFHYSLYDIPGNCNSFPYRFFVDLLMRTDYAIVLLKILAYLGDFIFAALTLRLFGRAKQQLIDIRTYLLICACLLSPVALLYSVAGMEVDSVCMCFILLGFLFYKKQKLTLAALSIILAPMLYPAYWPIAFGVLVFMLATTAKKTSFTPKLLVPVGIFIVFLLLSFAMENLLSTENYFWGKIFVIDPTTEMPYESPLLWLNVMFKIYGYSLSIGSLLLAIRHKKMRLVTLFIHVLVIMIVGWQMTSHFAV